MSELGNFIVERWSIKQKREAGLRKPWTRDKILQAYRFCNVDREDDTVTRWIRSNWRDPNSKNPDLWFAMTVARYINWPETLAELGFPVPYSPAKLIKVAKNRAERGLKIWTGAYTISTNGVKMAKPRYIAQMLQGLWEARATIRPRKGDTLSSFAQRLNTYNGVGSFMTGQVIADVKHAQGSLLNDAADWWTFAISGPGSRRGLNRVMGRPTATAWKEKDWANTLKNLLIDVKKELPIEIKKVLCAQNLQNCLCEFDKYERVLLGEGRPRTLYNGLSN